MVKSNAIIYGKALQTIGVGAGQMSRVNSARIAAIKAEHAGLEVNGACMASDAFFPFVMVLIMPLKSVLLRHTTRWLNT